MMRSGQTPTLLQMPAGMPDLIEFGLEPLQLKPHIMVDDFMSYRLNYASGHALTVAILYVLEKHLIFLRKPVINISVVDMDDRGRTSRTYLRYSIPPPKGPHDMEFSTQIMARVAAMTRAVADDLQAGDRVS